QPRETSKVSTPLCPDVASSKPGAAMRLLKGLMRWGKATSHITRKDNERAAQRAAIIL
ncbi:hypothetical protein Pmar_PMAR011772, partial [Perkinsus marinus ATCC 50983]